MKFEFFDFNYNSIVTILHNHIVKSLINMSYHKINKNNLKNSNCPPLLCTPLIMIYFSIIFNWKCIILWIGIG